MQRLRISFSRGEEVKYLSHLDLMRLWERALRRAKMPLAYSQGFSPHPKISIAAPLPLGVTSETELADVILTKRVSPYYFMKVINGQLPRGIGVIGVTQVAMQLPALQSQVRLAEYRVKLETHMQQSEVKGSLDAFLAKRELPWQHRRDDGIRKYDLRTVVDDLWLIDCSGACSTIGMRLRNDSKATGRAEQVTLALGFPNPPLSIHRTKLILLEGSHEVS